MTKSVANSAVVAKNRLPYAICLKVSVVGFNSIQYTTFYPQRRLQFLLRYSKAVDPKRVLHKKSLYMCATSAYLQRFQIVKAAAVIRVVVTTTH